MTKAINPKTKTSERKLHLVSWIILSVYSVLIFLGAVNHEMWLDEAQAWVILRDAPLSELPRILNIEGHPPLWYAVLYPFVKLGFPAEYAPLISWFFSASGAAVLLFGVKLPQPLKYTILASSGFLFYNSVMLRVYSLVPLLMFLILWVYPKRREHGIIYGLLIALLANTHIFVCGIVGILGIFMLVDLFTQWRDSSKKENAGKLAGLAVAGAGVLTLVIPLLGSAESNGAANAYLSLTPRAVFLAATTTFNDVFTQILQPKFGGAAWLVALMSATLLLWGMIILLRHWRRALAVEIGFLVFYHVTCGLFWITIPNRAVIFILSFAFALGIAQHEQPVFKESKTGGKITSPALKKLMDLLKKADKHAEKVYTVILAAFLVISVPSGAVLLCRDIAGNFSSAKETAEYISENFEEDAVFVVLRCGLPELSVYDPDIRLYAAGAGGFGTYARWEYMYRPPRSAEEVIEDLSEYEHLYIIHYYGQLSDAGEALYTGDGMTGFDTKNSLIIREYSDELIENYLYFGA